MIYSEKNLSSRFSNVSFDCVDRDEEYSMLYSVLSEVLVFLAQSGLVLS